MINIGGDQDDSSYRYKMPRLLTKVEGRGNGIKTVIPNMVDIAKCLHTDPKYPTKYFGIELGAQSKYDPKTERAVVNGQHQSGDMQKILTKFIEMFILCPGCGYPEIKWTVGKSSIKIDCAACGHNGVIKTNHRLVGYITKQKAQARKMGKGVKESRKERQQRREKEKHGGNENSKPSRKNRVEEEEVVWETDVSKDAVRERKEAEFKSMSAGRGAVSTASAKDTPVVVLRDFIKTQSPSVKQITGELDRLQIARTFNGTEKIKILLESLIDTSEPKSVPKQFSDNAELLKKFASDEVSAAVLLGCVEEFAGVADKRLLPRLPIILQALYDADVLEEEAILKWASSPPEASWVNKDVAIAARKAAQPFADWLENAESEEDSS